MEILNCTPHNVDIQCADGSIRTLEPCGVIPRCTQKEEELFRLDGSIIVTRQFYGEVVDLPEYKEGTFLIVSRLVAEAAPRDRKDLLIPGPVTRDETGRINGCRGLSVRF